MEQPSILSAISQTHNKTLRIEQIGPNIKVESLDIKKTNARLVKLQYNRDRHLKRKNNPVLHAIDVENSKERGLKRKRIR